MTKITVENCYGKYSVESDKDDMNMQEMLELLVRPALRCVGYSDKTIDEYLNEPNFDNIE